MSRFLIAAVVLMIPVPALAQHPGCIIRDDPHTACTAGTVWDAQISGCLPIVSS